MLRSAMNLAFFCAYASAYTVGSAMLRGGRSPALAAKSWSPAVRSAAGMHTLRGGEQAISMKAAGLCKKLEVPGDLLDSVDVFIFDCDGVIWKGDSLIDGVPAVLEMLRKAGKKIFFVTNNSTKSRKGYQGKFTGLGLTVEPEEIFSSSFAAAAYLEQTKFKETGKKVYIIGEVGIQARTPPSRGSVARLVAHRPPPSRGSVAMRLVPVLSGGI